MSIFNLEEFRSSRLPTEEEIMSTWVGNSDTPMVSVICATFNQEGYIHDAIRGFLIQRTEFPFEIIIHDDASTDHTAQIVHDYTMRYPKLIRPILQKENQYCKAPNSVLTISAGHARGEYLAICEGDDFWISSEKLKIQLEEMLKHPEINISFHREFRGGLENPEKNVKETLRSRILFPKKMKVFSPRAVILGDGGFMPTASIVIKKNVILELPDWFLKCKIGDYFIQILGAHPYGALYIPHIMSFYREGAVGSWSANVRSTKSKYVIVSNIIKYLGEINSKSCGAYSMDISIMRKYYLLNFLKENENLSHVMKNASKVEKNITLMILKIKTLGCKVIRAYRIFSGTGTLKKSRAF